MGYCYDMRGRLVCDNCGNSGGVRKRRCPSGWCTPAALCAPCNTKVRASGKWKERHATCPEHAARYQAEQDERARRIASGEFLRSAALGYKPDGVPMVRVLFTGQGGATVGYDMTTETYRGIPLGASATPDDYRAIGALTEAPASLHDCYARL